MRNRGSAGPGLAHDRGQLFGLLDEVGFGAESKQGFRVKPAGGSLTLKSKLERTGVMGINPDCK